MNDIDELFTLNQRRSFEDSDEIITIYNAYFFVHDL